MSGSFEKKTKIWKKMAPKGAANQRRANDRVVMSNQRVHTESDRFVDCFFFASDLHIWPNQDNGNAWGWRKNFGTKSRPIDDEIFPLIGRLMSRKLRLCAHLHKFAYGKYILGGRSINSRFGVRWGDKKWVDHSYCSTAVFLIGAWRPHWHNWNEDVSRGGVSGSRVHMTKLNFVQLFSFWLVTRHSRWLPQLSAATLIRSACPLTADVTRWIRIKFRKLFVISKNSAWFKIFSGVHASYASDLYLFAWYFLLPPLPADETLTYWCDQCRS